MSTSSTLLFEKGRELAADFPDLGITLSLQWQCLCIPLLSMTRTDADRMDFCYLSAENTTTASIHGAQ